MSATLLVSTAPAISVGVSAVEDSRAVEEGPTKRVEVDVDGASNVSYAHEMGMLTC